MEQLTALIGKRMSLRRPPGVFKHPRYLKIGETLKIYFPNFP
jgi:hypothetical protein